MPPSSTCKPERINRENNVCDSLEIHLAGLWAQFYENVQLLLWASQRERGQQWIIAFPFPAFYNREDKK